jgi:hypothetical protein
MPNLAGSDVLHYCFSLGAMFDPLRPLKLLPWVDLLQVGLLTTLVVSGIEWLLDRLARLWPPLQQLLIWLLSPPSGLLVQLIIAIGIGALAVIVLERRFAQQRITVAVLWALVPCLMLWLGLRSFIPIPPLAGALDFAWVVALILGIFWRGRSYRRW